MVGHAMLPLWPESPSGEAIYVDVGIVHLIRDLNARGYTTKYSCQGVLPSRRGYISFSDLSVLSAVTSRLQDLLASDPELHQRFIWGPDDVERDDCWSLRVHRKDSVWSFSMYFPPLWLRALEDAVCRESEAGID